MFAGSASATQLFLTCETRQELKTVNSSNKVIQDDWFAFHIELQIDGNVYHLSITEKSGMSTNVNGNVNESATKFILIPYKTVLAANVIILPQQTYVDRQTGLYVHSYQFDNTEHSTYTSMYESGPCAVTDTPKTKF